MNGQRLNEWLNGRTMDLETLYWSVLKEQIHAPIAEEERERLKALEAALRERLGDEVREDLTQWLELTLRHKDAENYASFLYGVRYGMKLLLDICD